MTMEIDGESEHGNEEIQKFLFMHPEERKKLIESSLKDLEEVEVEHQREEQAYKASMKQLIEIRITHAKMKASKEMSRKIIENLHNSTAKLKVSATNTSKLYNSVLEQKSYIEKGIEEARAKFEECKIEISEVQKEIEAEKQKSRENVHVIKMKAAMKEDSLTATERIKKIKIDRLAEIEKERAKLEADLNNLQPDTIEAQLKELTESEKSLQTEVNDSYLVIREEKEKVERENHLQEEYKANIEKAEAIVKKVRENLEKARSLLQEKEKVFDTALKNKLESEHKKIINKNLKDAAQLRDEIKKSEETTQQLQNIHQKCNDIQQKLEEAISKLSQRKENIKNNEEEIEELNKKKIEQQENVTIQYELLSKQINEVDSYVNQLQSQIKNSSDEKAIAPVEASDSSFEVDLQSVISSLSILPDDQSFSTRNSRDESNKKRRTT